MDGTLLDTQQGIIKAVDYALESFGIETEDKKELVKFIGPPLINSFVEFYGFSEEDAFNAIQKYREFFALTGMFQSAIYFDTFNIIERLKSNRVVLAVVTSLPGVYAEVMARYFGFFKYITYISGSKLDGSGGEKKELIKDVLDMLCYVRNMNPIIIGDTCHDITAAVECGIDSIGVTWGYGTRETLEKTRASYIAESADELCELIL
jgi:phosphoglycolate phosphatase